MTQELWIKASTTSTFGGAFCTFGLQYLSVDQWVTLSVGGVTITAVIINIYYKRKADKREEIKHQLFLKRRGHEL